METGWGRFSVWEGKTPLEIVMVHNVNVIIATGSSPFQSLDPPPPLSPCGVCAGPGLD